MNSPPNGENKCDILEEIDNLCRQLETITAKIKMLKLQQKDEEKQEHHKRVRRKKESIDVGDLGVGL